MKHRVIPAILSGGAGTRLWPMSTEECLKQFYSLGGVGSLIQETLQRVRGESQELAFAAPSVLASARHAGIVDVQLREIGIEEAVVVLEPCGRNTAAAAVRAAAIAKQLDPHAPWSFARNWHKAGSTAISSI